MDMSGGKVVIVVGMTSRGSEVGASRLVVLPSMLTIPEGPSEMVTDPLTNADPPAEMVDDSRTSSLLFPVARIEGPRVYCCTPVPVNSDGLRVMEPRAAVIKVPMFSVALLLAEVLFW